jgi:limonene-1,2-epoxide hydrolase
MMMPAALRPSMSRRAFGAVGLGALATLGLARPSFAQAAFPSGKVVPPETEKANVAVVNAFCAAFARKDLTKAVSLLADNCSYRTTQTRPPILGKDKVAETIKGFIERGAEFKVLKTVALGPLVLNERDDTVVMATGKETRTFHVAAGLFFVENGKIAEWTDYLIL